MRKYVLDTNLYVHAFRSADAAADLQQFYARFTPSVHLSAVVLHELLVGATSQGKVDEILENVARPFRRVGRVLTPSEAAWEKAGAGMARMARVEKLDRKSLPKSLANDFLLAASCREAGAMLITENLRDFQRIEKYVAVEHVAPWPC